MLQVRHVLCWLGILHVRLEGSSRSVLLGRRLWLLGTCTISSRLWIIGSQCLLPICQQNCNSS